MKFEFDGREYDTDKPICVLGVQYSSGDWHAKSASSAAKTLKDLANYGVKLKVKKLYVTELKFCKYLGNDYEKNNIIKMRVMSSQRDETVWIDKDNAIGHSPQECLKIYRAMQEAAG